MKKTTTKIPVLFFLFVLLHSLNVFAQSTYILDYASESITNNVNDYTIAAGLTSPTNFTIDWGNGGELPGTYTNALVKVVPEGIIPVDRGTLGANDGWGFNAKSWGLQLTADNNFSVDALKLGRRSAGNSNRNDFTISGYKDGQLTVSQTLTWTVYGASDLEVFTRGTGSWIANPAWNNIDKLVVSWPDPQKDLTDYQEIAVINISVSDPVAANSTPTVTTLVTSSITATGATLNGDVTDDGGAMVTERGFVYGTNSNPTIGDGRSISVAVGNGIGTYNEAINGLLATTTYYVRAYAINSEGTNYGSEKSFSTLSSPFENFSWSADDLTAGATGVTYTFSYTTVTAMSGAYDAILYALQSVNSGWNTENVSVEDVSVTIDGVKRAVSNVWTGSASSSNRVFIGLTDPLVPAGSEVSVTIGDVINNSTVASYPWKWIRTANGGGHQIDEAESPDPIVLTAPTAKGAITITNAPSDPSSDWLLSEGKLIPLVDGAKVNVDVVNNALASGDLVIEAQTDVFIDANITPVLSADRTLTLKANRDINLEANSSIAANGFSLNTIIWSDADALEGGVAYIKNRAEILTNGGHLWIGGGSDSDIWNGLTVGNGTSTGNTTNSNGITLIKTNIQTDGGNIAFYGKGLPGFNAGIPTPISTGNSTNANGIRLHDGNLIDAGFGTIYMYGYANNQHPTSNSNGVELSQTVGAPDVITSSNNTERAIFIEGHAEGPSTVANSWGFYSHLSTVENTGGGTVHIKGSAVKNSGVSVATNGAILAASGKIILEGTAAGVTSPSVLVQGAVGQKENTNVTLSDANVEIIGDRFSISGQAPNGRIQSSGKLAIHAYTNGIDIGLGSALATLQLPASYFISNFADGFSEILIGDANTGTINIDGKLLYQDPLTLKTNNNIVFNAQADVGSESANALTLWARAKGDNEANDTNFGAIWMKQGSTIHTAGGNLTMGGGSDPYIGYAMGDPSVPSAENNAIYRGVAMNGSINAAGGHIIINGRGSSASSVSHARGVSIGGPIETTGSGNITIRGIGRGLSDAMALGDSYFFPNAVGTLKTETGNITIDGKPSSPNRNGLSISTSGSYIQTNGNFSATTNGRITATAGALDIGGSTYLEALDHITLTHENNDFDGSITVTSASNLQLTDINELILGEISASGTIVIATQNGDVTIAESISSTNATVDAIQIFADKDKNAGDPVGGNIKISGTPVISTGAGGQAKFYSGSILGSAGLIALIGEDNTRYNVDVNTTIFDPVLGSGNYALIREKENLPPTATNVSFSGALTTMQELTATYVYNDAENDLETGTTYQWYRADDSNGTGKLAIESANAITYTLSQEDIGKFISFEVTPKNAADTGVPVESIFKGPIADVFSARISASINVSCNGGSDGSATVEIAGGIGPYSYSWNDPSGSTTSVVENLAAGTYVVTITDSRNQETTASVTITEPEVYTVVAPEDVVACGSYSLPVLMEGNYFTQPDGKGTALFAEDLITSSQTLYVYGENENGCTDEKSFDITINENDIAAVIFSDHEVVYDGEEHTLAVVGLPDGASVDYNVENTYTNVGSYKVTATVTSAHSSCPHRILTATLTINKTEAAITADAIQSFTYDGTVKNVSASLNHSETELTYAEQQGYADAGTYQVIISSEETANYQAASKEVSLVIEKAEITGVTFEG
ncbi:SprB repeat-containing protein, partial [Arenibacter nanhaiticus]